jgi:hypothetical protein
MLIKIVFSSYLLIFIFVIYRWIGQYKHHAKGEKPSALHFERAKLQEKNDICNFY